jgi:hypothetical protein
MFRETRVFLKQFFRQYHTTGSVLPSSRALAKALCRYVDCKDQPSLSNGSEGQGSGGRNQGAGGRGQGPALPIPSYSFKLRSLTLSARQQ